jgi:hypothetical protein
MQVNAHLAAHNEAVIVVASFNPSQIDRRKNASAGAAALTPSQISRRKNSASPTTIETRSRRERCGFESLPLRHPAPFRASGGAHPKLTPI